MASVGIPKYALIPLFILYFGIDDAPKLWLIGLLVFYPVFIAVFAGIRNVDRRLINMARIAGASEVDDRARGDLEFVAAVLFAALKIALPRAVSAAMIGEFLVGNEGLGYLSSIRGRISIPRCVRGHRCCDGAGAGHQRRPGVMDRR